MSSKTLARLLGVAAGLLGLWLVIRFLPSAGGDDSPSDGWGDFFDRLNRVTVTEVQLDGADGPRVIRRAGDRWTVDGLPADSGTVARFWESVESASITNLVARNPENHGRMGLAEDAVFRMTFQLEDENRTLLVGHAGSSAGTSFVRRPDGTDAYLLSSNFNAHMTRSLADWRDRRVVVLDTAAVGRIRLEAEDGSHTLSRGDSIWALESGSEADASAVRGILEELATLRANGFAEEGNEIFEAPPQLSLTALTGEGDTLTVLTLGEGEGDRWVTARGDTTVFRIPSFRVSRLIPSAERLSGG